VLELSVEETIALKQIAAIVRKNHDSVQEQGFLRNVGRYSHLIPDRIFQALYDFKYCETNYGLLILRGYPVDDECIGDFNYAQINADLGKGASLFDEETLLMVLSSVLGDPIGWKDQRNGKFINDLVPIRGDEHKQAGTGSKAYFEWHVEEAFSDYRADYLGMMCIRNPDHVVSTFGSVNDLVLDEAVKQILFEPRFKFLPYQRFQASGDIGPRAVLFGDRHHPYLRVDPADMTTVSDDAVAAWALQALIAEVNAHLIEVVLEPGDLYFIDNYRVVHGRKGFEPRYDGRDRWLKRVNLVRDLRKSRAIRSSDESRVLISY
jgi:hypothetical protein